MYLGTYEQGNTVYISCVTHRFETGEVENATVTGYIIKVGEALTEKISLTFNQYDSKTGLYIAEYDSANLNLGNYIAVIQAVINSVNVIDTKFFCIIKGYGQYGANQYGYCKYF